MKVKGQENADKESRKEIEKKVDKEAEDKVENEADKKAKEKTENATNKKAEEKAKKEADKEAGVEPEQIKKSEKTKKVLLVFAVVLILVVSLAAGYVFVARSYSSRFLPASQINGIDCSDMDAAEVSARLTPSVDDYVLEVTGRDFATGESGAVLGRIKASDIEMHYEGVLASVENVLAQQNEYKWIFSYFTNNPTNYSVAMTMSCDEEKVKSFVQTWDAFQAKNMRESQKAYISEYLETINGYQVIPKTSSTRINTEQAFKHIIDAVYNHQTELDLETLGCYEDIVDQNEEKLNETVNTANKWLSASVTYDWNDSKVVLDKEQLREWITIVDDQPVLDEDQVKRFVKKQASAHDTYGKTGSFTTVHKVTLNLYHASYGWKTDIDAETEELVKLIREGSTVNREPAYSVVARKKGTDDIGDSYVEVDLTHQHLYLHIDGQIVLETDFVSGTMINGNATPQGIFGITYKKTDAVLRGADYETPVSYWMPFYGNYGMHDATWRRVFGGDIFISGGSHGCVNLPLDKAAEIYQYMSKGFPVICYYYDVDPLASQEAPPANSIPDEGQGNNEGQNLIMGENSSEVQNPEAGQNVSEVQNPGAGQNVGEIQNPEAGQNVSEGQNPGTGQNVSEVQNPEAGQNVSEVQNPGAGQNIIEEQNTGEVQGDNRGTPPV